MEVELFSADRHARSARKAVPVPLGGGRTEKGFLFRQESQASASAATRYIPPWDSRASGGTVCTPM